MSTATIYGDWDHPRVTGDPWTDRFQSLWHILAAQNVGTPQFEPNFGLSQRRAEITELWKLFCQLRPKVIVEVGVAQGGTLAGWCELAPPDATIIAWDRDLNDCRPRPGEPVHPSIFRGQAKMTCEGGGAFLLKKHGQQMHAIDGWSYDVRAQARLMEILNGRKIDFSFNDASHSKGMFAADFKFMWPLIADGGIYAVHDIQASKAEGCDKRVEWERIIAEEEYSAVFEYRASRHDDSLGIGVLIK